MAFRTVEINNPAEIHIRDGQLEVMQEAGMVTIPIEDICQITTIGSNIRLSTMDLSILSQNKVAITTLDKKYLPTAIILRLTEKQYSNINIIVQEYDRQEEMVGKNCHVML